VAPSPERRPHPPGAQGAKPAGSIVWWLVPLMVASAIAGLGLQGLMTLLWIVAKSHLR
jgi:hypothetical protein